MLSIQKPQPENNNIQITWLDPYIAFSSKQKGWELNKYYEKLNFHVKIL